jgi:hypothetical protein
VSCGTCQVAASAVVAPDVPPAMAVQKCPICGQFVGDGHVCPERTAAIQGIFDHIYEEVTSMPDMNEYTALVRGLEAAFGAAGYDVTADELAGVHHNELVMLSRITDVEEIAARFCQSLSAAMRQPIRNYEIRQMVDGETPWGLRKLGDPLRIAGSTLAAWNNQVDRALKEAQPPIRRNTRRYKEFIAGKAAQAANAMQTAAREAIAGRQAELSREMSGQEEELRAAQKAVDRLRRTAFIVAAFLDVGGLEDRWGVAEQVKERARTIEKGIRRRREQMEAVAAHCQGLTPDEVIAGSVRPHKDLSALWEKHQEEAGGEL